MNKGLKGKILNLRRDGKSYPEIRKILKCSKGTISYHCSLNGLSDIGLKGVTKPFDKAKITDLNEYYKFHTMEETANKFGISKTTVIKFTNRKLKFFTPIERRHRNYLRIKTLRQRVKTRAVEYKGGKCESCGYDKCVWAFDFHHLKKHKKDFSISKYSTFSWNKIKRELDKCVLLCANCHRELHYNEKLVDNLPA